MLLNLLRNYYFSGRFLYFYASMSTIKVRICTKISLFKSITDAQFQTWQLNQ